MWADWVATVSGGASARAVAAKVHRSHTSMAKWFRENGVPAEVVIQVARAYEADPIAGLLAAGCLSKDELVPHFRSSLKWMPVSMLTAEVHERASAWEAATGAGEKFRPWFVVPAQEVSAG